MSVVDEDTELRDLLVQTLDKNGVLGKIKAELRANIFLALEAQDQTKNQSSFSNNAKIQNFINKSNSQTCVDLIHEFLQFLNLEYTSAVFTPETNTTPQPKLSETLRHKLRLPDNEDVPVLASLVSCQATNQTPSNKQSKEQRDRAQRLFTANLNRGYDQMSASSAVEVLSSLCPRFPLFLVERFVSEESKSLYQSGITLNSFLSIYEKLFVACHSVVTESIDPLLSNPSEPKSPIEDDHPSEDSFLKQAMGLSDSRIDHDRISSALSPGEPPTSPSGGQYFDDDYYYTKPKDPPVKFSGAKPTITRQIPPPKDYSKSTSEFSEKGSWSTKNKSGGSGFEKHQTSYDDDFNSSSQASISEDLQVDSLLSSAHSSAAELTEDRTISEGRDLKADYMEKVRM